MFLVLISCIVAFFPPSAIGVTPVIRSSLRIGEDRSKTVAKAFAMTPPQLCTTDEECSSGYYCGSVGQCLMFDFDYCKNPLGDGCGIGDGDCDNDDECIGDLRCGTDICHLFHNGIDGEGDCCYEVGPMCTTDEECSSGYYCGSVGQCLMYESDYCSNPLGDGCDIGDGDCDYDDECMGDLRCGKNNCGRFEEKADCCYQVPTESPTYSPTECHTSSNDFGTWNVCVGRCRTSSDGLGEWDEINASLADCAAACGKEARYFAYEHKGSTNRCELHTERVSKVNGTGTRKNGTSLCGIKMPSIDKE